MFFKGLMFSIGFTSNCSAEELLFCCATFGVGVLGSKDALYVNGLYLGWSDVASSLITRKESGLKH